MKDEKHIATAGVGSTQDWKRAGVRPHVSAMNRRTRDGFCQLKKAGFAPVLAHWSSFAVGTPCDLKMNADGWEKRVVFHEALVGIVLERREAGALVWLDVVHGWVYGCTREGASVVKGNQAFSVEDFLRKN